MYIVTCQSRSFNSGSGHSIAELFRLFTFSLCSGHPSRSGHPRMFSNIYSSFGHPRAFMVSLEYAWPFQSGSGHDIIVPVMSEHRACSIQNDVFSVEPQIVWILSIWYLTRSVFQERSGQQRMYSSIYSCSGHVKNGHPVFGGHSSSQACCTNC